MTWRERRNSTLISARVTRWQRRASPRSGPTRRWTGGREGERGGGCPAVLRYCPGRFGEYVLCRQTLCDRTPHTTPNTHSAHAQFMVLWALICSETRFGLSVTERASIAWAMRFSFALGHSHVLSLWIGSCSKLSRGHTSTRQILSPFAQYLQEAAAELIAAQIALHGQEGRASRSECLRVNAFRAVRVSSCAYGRVL